MDDYPPYLLACELWELATDARPRGRANRQLLHRLDLLGWRLMQRLGDAPLAATPDAERRHYQSAERLVRRADRVVEDVRGALCLSDRARTDALLAAIKQVVSSELVRLGAGGDASRD